MFHENPTQLSLAPPGGSGDIGRIAGGSQRVVLPKAVHQLFITGVDHPHHGSGLLPASLRVTTEARLTAVEDEQISRQHMPPAGCPGPHAVIGFFTVAPAEVPLVEGARLRQAVPPQIHAETDRRWDVDRPARIGLPEDLVELRRRPAGRESVRLKRDGIAGQGRVVGEGGHRPDKVALRRPPEPVEPARRHEGVAVEEHHVTVGMQGEAAVGRGDKAQVGGMFQKRELPAAGPCAEHGREFRLRAGVVDHDQLKLPAASQHRVEAGERRLTPAIHRHNDVHHLPCHPGWSTTGGDGISQLPAKLPDRGERFGKGGVVSGSMPELLETGKRLTRQPAGRRVGEGAGVAMVDKGGIDELLDLSPTDFWQRIREAGPHP